jgi:putative copper export protein
MTPALIKTLAYLGVVLLVGAGLFKYGVGPELLGQRMRRRLRWGALLGAALVVAASLGDVAWTIATILGRFDPAITWDYLLTSNHGRATLLRSGLALLLAALTVSPRTYDPALLTVPAVGVLATFSYLSHGTAMHGSSALLADLGHFIAATLWGGAVLYTALSPAWHDSNRLDDLNRVVARVSSIGLFSVLLLTATGLYASTMHLDAPALLVTSAYGRVLSFKVALVVVILGIAALNRWWFVPALRRGQVQRRFGRILKVEALLLIGVLAATGLLTTSPLPHD